MGWRCCTLFVCLFVALRSVPGATSTWDGGGADDKLTTPQNWLGDQAPASDPSATDLVFAGNTRLSPVVDVPFAAKSVSAPSGAGAFSLSGSTLSVGAGGIINNSTSPLALSAPVDFSGTAGTSVNAATGSVSFGGAITLPGNTLAVTAASPVSFGDIMGSGLLLKQGSGTMTLSPAASLDLDLTVSAGTVTLAADGSLDQFSSSCAVAVNGSSTLNFNENVTLDGAALTRASGAVVNVANGKTWTLQNGARATITGGITLSTSGSLLLTGADTRFSTSGTTTFAGGATLQLSSGAQLTTSGFPLVFGNNGGGSGIVDGSGTTLTAGALRVGDTNNQTATSGTLTLRKGSGGSFGALTVGSSFASGTVTIETGASATVDSLTVSSNNAPLSGAVTINGSGSSLTVTSSSSIGGSSGTRRHLVRVENGGLLMGPSVALNIYKTGGLALAAGTFNCNGGLLVAGGEFTRDTLGVFNLAAGKNLDIQQAGSAAFTGDFALPSGSAVQVSSGGASLAVTGRLIVGSGSTASIFNQAAANVHALEIGTAGNGSVLVSTYLSSLTADVTTIAASGYTGTLSFDGGGGTLGSVSIANSTFAATNGKLEIKNATVQATDLQLARNTAGTGTINVNGSGSFIIDGAAGVGAQNGSTGTVNVGNLGTGGTFLVNSGPVTIDATGALRVYASGRIGGSSSFQGAGVIDIAGTYSPGALDNVTTTAPTTFAQNMIFNSSTVLQMDLLDQGSGFTADHISFLGAGTPQVTWNGTLNVNLAEGTLRAGNAFKLFGFDPTRSSGAFSAVNLPSLNAGLSWRIDRLYVDGSIEVLSNASTYAQWQTAYGTGAFNADDDRDGVPNGIEFLLGTNPKSAFAAGESPVQALPVTKNGSGVTAGVTFEAPATSPSDTHYRVRATSDLVNWTLIASKDGTSAWSGSATVTTSAAAPGRINVKISESLPLGTTRRFYRLEAVAP